MERCQAYHGSQQGPDNYADKQILGSLQLHHQLGCSVHRPRHILARVEGLSDDIPGRYGGPSYSEDSRGETQELQTKTW